MPIQKCHARVHMRGSEYFVYSASMAMPADENGQRVLYAGNESLAARTGYSPRAVGSARQRLQEKGWLLPLNEQKKTGRGGSFETKRFRVVEHDEWAAAHPGECKPIGATPTTVTPTTVADLPTTVGQHLPTTVDHTTRFASKPALKSKSAERSLQSEKTDGERPPAVVPSKAKGKKQNLKSRIAAKVAQQGTLLEALNEFERTGYPPWWNALEDGLAAMRYRLPADDPTVGVDFAIAIADTWENNSQRGVTPAILCSKTIDRCRAEQTMWPPAFQEHRNRLMEEEKASAAAVG